MKKKCMFPVFFVAILGLLTASSPVSGAITLTFSSHLSISAPIAKALDAKAKEIGAKTNGEIRIDIYPFSRLSKLNENFNAVAEGKIDMAFTRLFDEEQKIPVFGVLDLPYVFPTLESVGKFCRGGLDDLLDKEANKLGVKIISVAFVNYAQCFTRKKLLLTPADYQGVRIGVYDENFSEAISTLGGEPVIMPLPDMYSALQRDKLDGHMGTVATMIARKFYYLEKYWVISPINLSPVHIIANLKSWDKLSPVQQKIIKDGLDEMADDLLDVFRKETLEAGVARLRQNGMHIHIQSAEEMDPFHRAMEPLYEQYIKRAGKIGKEALNMAIFDPFSFHTFP